MAMEIILHALQMIIIRAVTRSPGVMCSKPSRVLLLPTIVVVAVAAVVVVVQRRLVPRVPDTHRGVGNQVVHTVRWVGTEWGVGSKVAHRLVEHVETWFGHAH